MKQTNLLKTFLLLCALIVGSTCAWADESSYTITFKDSGTSSDASAKKTTISDIIASGADYVSAIPTSTNVYQARIGRGIKLGASSKAGSLTLTLKDAVTPTKITFKARYYNENETSITVNGTAITDLTGDFDEYTINYDGSTEVTSIAISTPAKRAYITQVTVYYNDSSEKTDPTITFEDGEVIVGKTLDLSTLFTSNSSGAVTYSITAGDAYASISGNILTGVASGSVTVEASQAASGSFNAKTAMSTITVNPAPAVAITLDFSTNIFGLGVGSSNKETTSHGYEYEGYTYTLAAADGYYYNTGYVMLGKSGSTLTFPAFPFNVSTIKVHGTSGASTAVTQNIFVGDEAVSTTTTGAKDVINVYDIDAAYQAAGNIYVLKVTSNANTQISKIEIIGYESTPAVSAAGWATYVTKNPVRFTEGEAFAVTSVGSSVGLTAVTDVPKGEPVLLKGAGAKTAEVLGEDPAAIENKLAVSDGTQGTGEYVLANHGGNVGFYKWTGSALASGKVYLPASEVAGARDFIGFDETTGIANINSDAKTLFNGDFYNLAGQRVAQPTKGLYIVNGRKVVVK